MGILVGVTRAEYDPALARLLETRREQGRYPPFVPADPQLRADPRRYWPPARTLVCLALPYPASDGDRPPDGLRGLVARSLAGPDYHRVVEAKIRTVANLLLDAGVRFSYRAWVDAVPPVERALAARAGLGFFGRNSCLVHPELGSWFWLGELALDAELPSSLVPPAQVFPSDPCGSCRRCLEACPTGALVAPYELDPYRCLSYRTQARGVIPREYRPLIGERLMGCDTCQEVCPYNRPRRKERPSSLRWWPLESLLDPGSAEPAAGTALAWRGRGVLARNAAVVLGNGGRPEAVGALAAALERHPSPVVRAHAAWALGRVGTRAAAEALRTAWRRERDDRVRGEIRLALEPGT
ncbi:MAG: tRNA epoxyqueuosine(34) reductase QueG [Clostridia bacterium]|nr:tRNA epoxyqueuosine(34) reductase QueG [Clostridia bacterium]MDH7573059.1 tRNA epoxyqueuosine(34) reductase QueG [Clostridia bacterium]